LKEDDKKQSWKYGSVHNQHMQRSHTKQHSQSHTLPVFESNKLY